VDPDVYITYAGSEPVRDGGQRVEHVVPVADVGDPDAVGAAEPLADRQCVGERLARVGRVGEAVDDRDRGVCRELVDVLLGERPDHEPVEVAREDGRRVADRLAAAELKLAGGQVDADAAELGDADLERDAGARRGFGEDEPERPAQQQVLVLSPLVRRLQVVREVERRSQLLGAPVRDPREVPALERLGDGDHGRDRRRQLLDNTELRFYIAHVINH